MKYYHKCSNIVRGFYLGFLSKLKPTYSSVMILKSPAYPKILPDEWDKLGKLNSSIDVPVKLNG